MKNWEKKFDKAFDTFGNVLEVYVITYIAIFIIVNLVRAI